MLGARRGPGGRRGPGARRVTLGCAGCWSLWDGARAHREVLELAGRCWSSQGDAGACGVVLELTEGCWELQEAAGGTAGSPGCTCPEGRWRGQLEQGMSGWVQGLVPGGCCPMRSRVPVTPLGGIIRSAPRVRAMGVMARWHVAGKISARHVGSLGGIPVGSTGQASPGLGHPSASFPLPARVQALVSWQAAPCRQLAVPGCRGAGGGG